MRSLGHRMMDDLFDYMQTVAGRPTWQPMPKAAKDRLKAPLPMRPEDPEKAYKEFVEMVLPYLLGNIHPRFWGWVIGTETPFGALAVPSPELRPLLKGMERADSLAFDLHKWMYMNYAAGCILIRHPESHRQASSTSGTFLARSSRGVAGDQVRRSQCILDFSRNAKGVKIWMSLKEYEAEKYGRVIQQDADQARNCGDLVEKFPDLELLAPIALNIVSFRSADPGLTDEQLTQLNAETMADGQESGITVPSGTVLDGRSAIRTAVINHRSRLEHFDLFPNGFVEFAQKQVPVLCAA